MVVGPTPPGHDGLTGELNRLEKKIDNGIKTAGPNHVLCIAQLATDVSVPAVTDTRPVTQWKATAETDFRGMYHYNESGDTWWQIPFKGYWRVLVHTRWASQATTATAASTTVLLNGTDPTTTAITEANGYNALNALCCYNAIVEDRVFAAGDKLRVNFWSRDGGTVNATSLAAFTHVVIRYLGTE